MNKKVKKMRLGSYMVKNGFLTLEQAQKVIQAQQSQDNGINTERFGRLAVKMGFITEKLLNKVVLQKEKQEFGF